MNKKVNLLLLGVASLSMVLASCGNPGGGGGKVEPSLTGISIKQGPTKTTYLVNETIDLAGLVVEALYSDESKAEVSNYTTNAADVDMSFAGTKAVVVTFEEKTASFTVTVRNTEKTDWTESEKSLMTASKYLYGEILPFIDLAGVTVYGDTTIDSKGNKGFAMQGGTLKKDDLKNYASKFRGWEGGDMSSSVGAEAGSYYSFEKAVQYNIGTETEPQMVKRYVSLSFYGMKNSKPAKEGTFTLIAEAAYSYTWAEAAEAFAKAQADDVYSQNVIPAPSNSFDRIQVLSSYYAIAAQFEAEGDDAGYRAKLEGWNIHEEKDKDGFYVAESPDGLYSISFLYSEGTFIIHFGPAFSWPAAAVAAYQADGHVAFQVAPYDSQEAHYYGYPTSSGEAYQVEISGSSQAEFEAYADKLAAAGWDVGRYEVGEEGAKELVSFEAEKFVDEVGYVYISGEREVSQGNFYVVIDVMGTAVTFETTWPGEDIAKELGDEITEVVPEPTFTVIGYYFSESYIDWSVLELVDAYVVVKAEGSESLEAYKTQLVETNNFELIDGKYYSPNREIYVDVEEGYHNTFVISFGANTYEGISSQFPQDKANSFAAAFGGANPVPAFPGADFYYVSTNGKAVYCVFDYEEDPEHPENTPEAAYSAILEEALWTEIEPDSYGYFRYVSPDGKVRLAFLYVAEDEEFAIYVENALPPEWPGEEITTNLQAKAGEYVFQDIVPSIDISKGENLAAVGSYYSDADVMITYATAEEAAEVLANYEAALIQAEYELDAFTGSTYRGVSKQYISKNGEIRAEVFVSGRTVYLLFYFRADVSATQFPFSDLQTKFNSTIPEGVVLQDSLVAGPVRDVNSIYTKPTVSSGSVRFEIDFDTMTALMEYVNASTVGYNLVTAESTETKLVYLSEHGEIKITYSIDASYVSSGWGVALIATITFNEDPNAKLARLFAGIVPSSYTMQDPIVELDFSAAKTYNIAMYAGAPYVGMGFEDGDARTAFLTAYAAALVEAKYTALDGAAMETYVSENEEIKVEFELSGASGVYINYYFVGDAEPDPDPAFAELKGIITTELGETALVDEVPAIPPMKSFSIEAFNNTDGIGISASFASMDDLTEFENAYKAALVEEGYTADGEGNYTTTNGQLTFSFKEDDYGGYGCYLTIFVKVQGVVTPTLYSQAKDYVEAAAGSALQDPVPEGDHSASIYAAAGEEEGKWNIFLVFDSEEAANAYVDAYKSALTTAGYALGTGGVSYHSEHEEIGVTFDVVEDDGYYYVNIYFEYIGA